ncbi:MAG: hypothetical protein HC921_09415 [Synechococcaceae cyanobacterium SM2_3_1]|nr:hypothetical protein [Synechococcaceae cyanobacterium SM2_3_1]
MVKVVIGISAAIALMVIGLESFKLFYEGWYAHRVRLPRPYWGVGLILALLCAMGLLVWDRERSLWVLVGGLLGLSFILVSALGRVAQSLAVLCLCIWAWLQPSATESFLTLSALGLGVGLTGVPALLLMSEAEGIGLLQGLTQLWVLIAACSWGTTLSTLTDQGPSGWPQILPVGVAALTLVGGAVPLLLRDQNLETEDPAGVLSPGVPSGKQPLDWIDWLGWGSSFTVVVLLAIGLIRNWLQQDAFYTLSFALGVGLSLGWHVAERMRMGGSQPALTQPAYRFWQAVMGVILVGGGGLLALRLGGSYGAALLGIGALTFRSYWGTVAALFLAVRPLTQSLLYQTDLNLSGINLTHTYTYAALYLGMASMILAFVASWLFTATAPLRTTVALTVACVALTAMVGYFIHLEPQSAFLLGSLIVALMAAALTPALSAGAVSASDWLGIQGLLFAILATLTALLTPELTLAGTEATRLTRLLVFAVLLLLLTGIWGLSWYGVRKFSPPAPSPLQE